MSKRYILTIDSGSEVCIYDTKEDSETSDINVSRLYTNTKQFMSKIHETMSHALILESTLSSQTYSEYCLIHRRTFIIDYNELPSEDELKDILVEFSIGK